MQISAIIPVFNEEDHIIDAIESVSWADEIIVVDSFSTDKTLALAQSKKLKFCNELINIPLPRKTGLFHKQNMIGYLF